MRNAMVLVAFAILAAGCENASEWLEYSYRGRKVKSYLAEIDFWMQAGNGVGIERQIKLPGIIEQLRTLKGGDKLEQRAAHVERARRAARRAYAQGVAKKLKEAAASWTQCSKELQSAMSDPTPLLEIWPDYTYQGKTARERLEAIKRLAEINISVNPDEKSRVVRKCDTMLGAAYTEALNVRSQRVVNALEEAALASSLEGENAEVGGYYWSTCASELDQGIAGTGD